MSFACPGIITKWFLINTYFIRFSRKKKYRAICIDRSQVFDKVVVKDIYPHRPPHNCIQMIMHYAKIIIHVVGKINIKGGLVLTTLLTIDIFLQAILLPTPRFPQHTKLPYFTLVHEITFSPCPFIKFDFVVTLVKHQIQRLFLGRKITRAADMA